MLGQYFSHAYLPPAEVGDVSELQEFTHQPLAPEVESMKHEAALI